MWGVPKFCPDWVFKIPVNNVGFLPKPHINIYIKHLFTIPESIPNKDIFYLKSLRIPDYNGFGGGLRLPCNEALVNKFWSQLSWYRNLLIRSAGHRNPSCFLIVQGFQGAKLFISSHPRIPSSADAKEPWKYCVEKRCRCILCINRSIILLVLCAPGKS